MARVRRARAVGLRRRAGVGARAGVAVDVAVRRLDAVGQVVGVVEVEEGVAEEDAVVDVVVARLAYFISFCWGEGGFDRPGLVEVPCDPVRYGVCLLYVANGT